MLLGSEFSGEVAGAVFFGAGDLGGRTSDSRRCMGDVVGWF